MRELKLQREFVSVLHIGYPKTATTSMQRNYFSKLPGTNLVGELPDREDSLLDFKISPIGRHHSQRDEACDFENTGFRYTCLSDELVLGANRRVTEQRYIARYLRGIFPNADIIITIRRQEDILRSLYCSDLSTSIGAFGVNLNLAQILVGLKTLDFDEWTELLLLEPSETWAGMLYYSEVVSIWMDVFGHDRVHIIPYEAVEMEAASVDELMSRLFTQSEIKFSDAMSGTRHRDRRSKSSDDLKRRLKKVLQTWQMKLKIRAGPLDPSIATLSKKNSNRILEEYRYTNAKMMELCRFDLEQYGYLG